MAVDLTGLTKVSDGLYMDAQGNFKQINEGTVGANNQWMWGAQGIQGLGGATPTAINDPFIGIQEAYRGGNAIEANSWQEAVSNSLQGFMRSNYGTDPIFNWIPGQSGLNGQGQFRLGTLQELANQGSIPGMFFDTTGPLARNINTGNIVDPTGAHNVDFGGRFDPLLGFGPDDKFLGFEDIPLQQLEMLKGSMPGQIFMMDPQRAALQREWDDLNKQALADPKKPGLSKRAAEIQSQLNSMPQPFISLADAQANGSLQDFNDFLFKLDMQQYQSPDELVKADPKAVLQQFFDTPAYRLLYGNDPGVLDPNLDPTERFRADPGYQWTQDEGMRQLQRNSAAKGLLESGATQRDLRQYGQGLADQNYQRFLGQQQGTFANWQNQLQGLSSQGANLSGQSAQNANALGQGLGQLGVTQGSALANLLGNQGVYGANAFQNTGGAQANTALQAASLMAQIQSANLNAQSQANATSAAQSGQSMQGISSLVSSLGGLFGGGGGGGLF